MSGGGLELGSFKRHGQKGLPGSLQQKAGTTITTTLVVLCKDYGVG